VLAVDGAKAATALIRRCTDQLARHHQHLFVGDRNGLTGM